MRFSGPEGMDGPTTMQAEFHTLGDPHSGSFDRAPVVTTTRRCPIKIDSSGTQHEKARRFGQCHFR